MISEDVILQVVLGSTMDLEVEQLTFLNAERLKGFKVKGKEYFVAA